MLKWPWIWAYAIAEILTSMASYVPKQLGSLFVKKSLGHSCLYSA